MRPNRHALKARCGRLASGCLWPLTTQHKDFDPKRPNHPVKELCRYDGLELYQSYQGKPKFRGARPIVSFYGLRATDLTQTDQPPHAALSLHAPVFALSELFAQFAFENFAGAPL